MRRSIVRPLVAGVGMVVCAVAMAATIVGHPVPTGVAAGPNLTYTSGAMDVSTIEYDLCDDPNVVGDVHDVLDPVAADTIVLPSGSSVCGLKINLDSAFELDGTGPANSSFALSLNVPSILIVVDPPIEVASDGSSGGTGIRIADPSWISAGLLDLGPNDNVTVGPGHSLHDALRDAVRFESTAW